MTAREPPDGGDRDNVHIGCKIDRPTVTTNASVIIAHRLRGCVQRMQPAEGKLSKKKLQA